MLINCKPGCSGKKVTTNGSLDIEQDEVICTFCEEIIPVSKFTKMTMKSQGDILKKDKRKPFQYSCLTCKKNVQTAVVNGNLVGLDCKKECKFNVSEFTIFAMSSLSNRISSEEVEKNSLDIPEDTE